MLRFPRSTTFLLALATVATTATTAAAQDDHDHEHEGVHFSHPLLNESPSPDTKLRVDYLWSRSGDVGARTVERSTRLEGEYAFTPAFSVAVTMPYVWRDATSLGGAAARGVGSTELSLKAATARWGERGVLAGGGLSVGLPTGSDARAIGSGRAVELEPFADVGYQRGALQVVAFGHYAATVRNAPGSVAERELSLAGSASYAAAKLFDALVEVEAVRPVSGEERAIATVLAPGVKVYPFANRNLMSGVSVPIGVSGEQRNERSVLVSLFYHF